VAQHRRNHELPLLEWLMFSIDRARQAYTNSAGQIRIVANSQSTAREKKKKEKGEVLKGINF